MQVAQAILLVKARKTITLNVHIIDIILKVNGHFNINVNNIIKTQKLKLQQIILNNSNPIFNNNNHKKYFNINNTLYQNNVLHTHQENQVAFLINNNKNLKKTEQQMYN